jgi:colanic acid/amylovoran biosynthesis protein
MRIHITNTVALNGGDAAILLSVLDLLKRAFGPETDFLIYERAPEVAARYYPKLSFRPSLHAVVAGNAKDSGRLARARRWLRKARMRLAAWLLGRGLRPLARVTAGGALWPALSEYDSADLVVSTGGTYLVENYDLTPRLFDYELTVSLKRPLVFFTQSLGPFTRPATRRALRRIFTHASAILVRDEDSRGHLKALGVDAGRVHVSADAVFALPRNGYRPARPASHGPRIAISVRQWDHFNRQRNFEGMTRFVFALQMLTQHLVDAGADVTFLSTCQGIPEYRLDDSRVAEEIVAGLPETVRTKVRIDRAFHHPLELVAQFGGYDAVIATRMHAGILALSAGVPVLPISYEFKTRALFARLGLDEWVQDIEQLDGVSLIQTADRFLRSLPQLRAKLRQAVELEQHVAEQSAELVREAFCHG